MKHVSTVTKAVVAMALFATANFAVAGSIDETDTFYPFYQFMETSLGGALGTGIALTMMLMGGIVGVARNSPMPALTGLAGAAFLHWGPDMIVNLMTNGAVV